MPSQLAGDSNQPAGLGVRASHIAVQRVQSRISPEEMRQAHGVDDSPLGRIDRQSLTRLGRLIATLEAERGGGEDMNLGGGEVDLRTMRTACYRHMDDGGQPSRWRAGSLHAGPPRTLTGRAYRRELLLGDLDNPLHPELGVAAPVLGVHEAHLDVNARLGGDRLLLKSFV